MSEIEEEIVVDLARRHIPPRPNYQKMLEDDGLSYHHELNQNNPYWIEDHYYEISQRLCDRLVFATEEVYQRCKDLISHILEQPILLQTLNIPQHYWAYLRDSWRLNEPHLVGRFDFTLDTKLCPKLIEFNLDTPTTQYESGILQDKWFRDHFGDKQIDYSQFNYIHPKLVHRFSVLQQLYFYPSLPLYCACVKTWKEDLITTNYIRQAAEQAGVPTKFIHIEDIGYDTVRRCFVDKEYYPIFNLYKLYPWEWLFREEFGQFIPTSNLRILQPSWTLLLNSKGILPLLWERNQHHPNLLPAFWEESKATYLPSYVKKPLWGREGANISIINHNISNNNNNINNYHNYYKYFQTAGPYDYGDFVFQETCALCVPEIGEWTTDIYYTTLPKRFVSIGSWIVGNEPAGFSFREDTLPIIHGDSSFVPHVVKRL